MFKLRPYQHQLVDQIYEAWERHRSVLCVCPTGGGKTVIFSKIASQHNGALAAIVHRKEIVGQISLSLARMGVKHRIIAPPATVRMIRKRHLSELGRSFVDPQALAGVASVQTLTSRSAANNHDLQRWIGQVTLAIFDEGHHYVNTGLWAKAVNALGRAKLLFVTATPERADGKGMGSKKVGGTGFCDVMVEGPVTKWLIDQGFLSKFTYRAPETDLDVAGLALSADGDFNAKALRARVVESHLVGDVVKHYRAFADGRRAIVFATDVESSEEMAAQFRADGYTAVSLSGATEPGERDRELKKFESGATQVLCNVNLFDEGFDVPAVECVIQARPTESLAKFLQMVGRGLRIMEGKTEAIIIDAVRNWERHGAPTWPRVWSMEDREKKSSGATDTMPQFSCEACTQIYEAFYKACPYCGHVPEVKTSERGPIAAVGGELIELDLDAMDALFQKIQRADMSDDEYRRDQLSRGIPSVGRAADMRRHQASKHRREVLRELVAWWMGMQPEERTLGEKQRRFYYRFGVDVGTAMTLKAADTDALIEKVRQGFDKDLIDSVN